MSDRSLMVVHEVRERYPIFRTEVPDPYPHSNGGQQLYTLKACPFLPLHICYSSVKYIFFFRGTFHNIFKLDTRCTYACIGTSMHIKVLCDKYYDQANNLKLRQ